MTKKQINIDQEKKWNKRAADYPRFSGKTSGIEDRVIELAESAGVCFAGKTVLDIACGTGRFTIRIAKKAEKVTGTDISEKMLELMRDDIAAENIGNIEIVRADWKEFPKERKWDITMATFTPAVRTSEDFEEMISMAKEYVIFLGWMKRNECGPVADIYGMHGVKPSGFSFPNGLTELLESGRYSYQMFPVQDKWFRGGSIERMTERFADDLREYGAEPDTKAIHNKLMEYSADGKIVKYTTDVNLQLAVISLKQ